jgi:drug/metabolite transporter (DMT)-like permease
MTPERENRTVGIFWMLATMLSFITLDALMKFGLETYSLVQVTWARFFFATLFAVGLCLHDFWRLARTQDIKVQILRSALLMITTGLFNAGIRDVPLATATTVMFLSPILVTLLSTIILGEHVGWRRWLGIGTGLVGAIVIVNPWDVGGAAQIGIVFLLIAAFTNASYQIATRYVRADDAMTSLLYTATAGAILTSTLVPSHWTWPDAWGWLVFVLCGLTGALGHLFLIRAFRAAPASVVAPFAYSSLIWATLFGFAIWGEWPEANVWVGATLIVAAGLYIFFRERALANNRGV